MENNEFGPNGQNNPAPENEQQNQPKNDGNATQFAQPYTPGQNQNYSTGQNYQQQNYQQQQQQQPNYNAPQNGEGKNDPFAIAGMVIGICSVVFCWVPGLGFILCIIGFIFSLLALSKINDSNGYLKGKGMAVAGLACSAFTLVVCIISLIACITACNSYSSHFRYWDY